MYFATEFVNLHRKLPTERGWGCDGFDKGTGQRADTVKTSTQRGARAPRSLASHYLCYTRCSGRGKPNFDSTYQRNNPNCLVVRDKLHKVKSHRGGRWNGNPDTSFLTGDRIDDSKRKCILLGKKKKKKKQMNYDSFHIKQTYMWQRALRTASTSTDTITNWPANHLALASKVQIRYLRSLKADSTVCRPSSLVLSEPCFASNEKKRLGLSSNMRKISDNSANAKKEKKEMEAIPQLRFYTVTEIAL